MLGETAVLVWALSKLVLELGHPFVRTTLDETHHQTAHLFSFVDVLHHQNIRLNVMIITQQAGFKIPAMDLRTNDILHQGI